MKTTQEGNSALVEIPFEGNQNYPAGVHVYKWNRITSDPKPSRFEVEIYVEGYRPSKDVWLHDTYFFTTLADALQFYHKIMRQNREEQGKELNFDAATQYNGWYGLTVEYMNVFEYTLNSSSLTISKSKWELS